VTVAGGVLDVSYLSHIRIGRGQRARVGLSYGLLPLTITSPIAWGCPSVFPAPPTPPTPANKTWAFALLLALAAAPVSSLLAAPGGAAGGGAAASGSDRGKMRG
jgi:hypothetical protein